MEEFSLTYDELQSNQRNNMIVEIGPKLFPKPEYKHNEGANKGNRKNNVNNSDVPTKNLRDSIENKGNKHPQGYNLNGADVIFNQEHISDNDLKQNDFEEFNNEVMVSNQSATKKGQVFIPNSQMGYRKEDNCNTNKENVEKHASGISDYSNSSGKAKKQTETPDSSKDRYFKMKTEQKNEVNNKKDGKI